MVLVLYSQGRSTHYFDCMSFLSPFIDVTRMSITAFYTQRPGNYSIFKSQEIDRLNWTTCYKEECIKWLNKVGTLAQGFEDWRKITRTVYQNLDDLQNLPTNLTVKV